VYVLRQNCRAAGWRWDTKYDGFVPKGASSSKTIFRFNENDDSSDESFVEPFGAGDSDADPDFVAELTLVKCVRQ
jgi:hypothetical protein